MEHVGETLDRMYPELPSAQFIRMLRAAKAVTENRAPPGPPLCLFCDVCQCDRSYALTAETALDEIYVCPVCGRRRAYRVR